MPAIRELETDQLDSRALTWMNRTFKYTHGYGLTMAPVNEFLGGGKPMFFEDKACLLYVEPVYLQAEGAKMPELKKSW